MYGSINFLSNRDRSDSQAVLLKFLVTREFTRSHSLPSKSNESIGKDSDLQLYEIVYRPE